ncbi:predicted protein [Postia placenta Mad-698-R]|nr:predicted protein [Postia placenta Mad-698-R]
MTCALDLSDFIDVSQLSSEPDSYLDLRADFLGDQAPLQPLPISRVLRCQNVPLELPAAAFSAWSDPAKVFLSNGHLLARSPSAFDILSRPTENGLVSGIALAGQIGSSLPGTAATPSDRDANNHINFNDACGRDIKTDTSSPGADQEPTTTIYDNDIHETSVEDEVDKSGWNGKDAAEAADESEARCDDKNSISNILPLATPPPATPLSDRSLSQSRPSSTTLHKAPKATVHQVESTGVNAKHSLRRSTRKRKRIEPAPPMVPVVSNHSIRPPKRARSSTSVPGKGKATAAAVVKPAPSLVPLKTTDGRYACPHCPARILQRYHDCLRHIDTSKRCFGWNGIMYPCHRCGSGYTRRDAVKRHMDDKPNCA